MDQLLEKLDAFFKAADSVPKNSFEWVPEGQGDAEIKAYTTAADELRLLFNELKKSYDNL